MPEPKWAIPRALSYDRGPDTASALLSVRTGCHGDVAVSKLVADSDILAEGIADNIIEL